jgi:hypothetical protein
MRMTRQAAVCVTKRSGQCQYVSLFLLMCPPSFPAQAGLWTDVPRRISMPSTRMLSLPAPGPIFIARFCAPLMGRAGGADRNRSWNADSLKTFRSRHMLVSPTVYGSDKDVIVGAGHSAMSGSAFGNMTARMKQTRHSRC